MMICHIGDILAVPFFSWLSYYFYHLPQRTPQETVLFLFSLGGLVADLIFSFQFARLMHSSVVNLFIIMYFVAAIILWVIYEAGNTSSSPEAFFIAAQKRASWSKKLIS